LLVEIWIQDKNDIVRTTDLDHGTDDVSAVMMMMTTTTTTTTLPLTILWLR
jgi:hypothetical protein